MMFCIFSGYKDNWLKIQFLNFDTPLTLQDVVGHLQGGNMSSFDPSATCLLIFHYLSNYVCIFQENLMGREGICLDQMFCML